MGLSPSLYVLVIEDDALMLATIKHLLKGHRLESFETLSDYLDQSQNSKPQKFDLVLLDMNMPQFGGKKVFEKIKSLKLQCKVIISSGLLFMFWCTLNIIFTQHFCGV